MCVMFLLLRVYSSNDRKNHYLACSMSLFHPSGVLVFNNKQYEVVLIVCVSEKIRTIFLKYDQKIYLYFSYQPLFLLFLKGSFALKQNFVSQQFNIVSNGFTADKYSRQTLNCIKFNFFRKENI